MKNTTLDSFFYHCRLRLSILSILKWNDNIYASCDLIKTNAAFCLRTESFWDRTACICCRIQNFLNFGTYF